MFKFEKALFILRRLVMFFYSFFLKEPFSCKICGVHNNRPTQKMANLRHLPLPKMTISQKQLDIKI